MNKHVDAIVIGAGAGGGIIAKELACSGMKTVLFERGGCATYDYHPNDELMNQRLHIIGAVHGPDRRKSPYVEVAKDGSIVKSRPDRLDYTIIAACVGSGTVSYGAMAWRFMPQDFRLKSIYGCPEGSTLADWPISYDDLEPFYEKAEWEIGVSGDNSKNPFAPPRKKNFPMPAFEFNKEAKVVAAAAERMGLHPFPIPMLRNSVPYNGRAACIRNRTCCGYACPVDAKNGTQNTVIPKAIESGNCELRTHCVVAEILMDGKRAKGVRYFDENNEEKIQTADVVVVAASACESARLLLNSRTSLFPNGIGNNFDNVGRNLQSHAYTGAWGLFDYDILELNGPGATLGISDFNHNEKEGIIGGVLCTEFYVLPYGFSRARPPSYPKWGREHKKFQRQNYRRMVRLHGPVQDVPTPGMRVQVEDSVRDFWGIPVTKFSGSRHPLDRKHCQFLSEKAASVLREAGAKQVWMNVGGLGRAGGQHQCGTCRMGDDPKTSVVDPNCKVWGVDNLYVGDGGVLVSAGGFNPVLTIMALAYRTGAHIAGEFAKKGSAA